jgi:putative transposase
MRQKRHSAEQIVAKLREAEKLQAQGLTIPQSCKRLGISDQTFYRWQIRYGALKEDEAQRLKALEAENSRPAPGARVRAAPGGTDERARRPPSPLRLPAHLGALARRGLRRQPQANRAPLARRGPPRAAAAQQGERQTSAGSGRQRGLEPGRRAPEPDLVVRLHERPHPRGRLPCGS